MAQLPLNPSSGILGQIPPDQRWLTLVMPVDQDGNLAAGGGGGGGSTSASTITTGINNATLPQLATVIGHVDGVEGLVTAMSAKLPASLGAQTAANSLSVTLASNAQLPAYAATPTFRIDQATPGTTNLVAVSNAGFNALQGGNPVAVGNPLFFRLSDGTAALGTAANPLLIGPGTNPTFTVNAGGRVTVASIDAVTTAATGTNYSTLGAGACTEVLLINLTGTQLEYRRGGAGVAMPVVSNSAVLIEGIANANEISIRRTDTSNTQVTATFA